MAVTEAPRSAAEGLSYDDLYARWERGNWRATELDFSVDREHWEERFSDFERTAALWNYALFFWGEDAVADNLSPYIDAAPREEQKYFLTTQQVDEVRHAVFFRRFMNEVIGVGGRDTAGTLAAIEPQLTWGFRKLFERLDEMADELRRDRSRPKLAAAVALYHLMIEATIAQTGQHFIQSYLEERDVMPGFREGISNVAADEQRHIGFGVKLLADLQKQDSDCAAAVAEELRNTSRFSLALFVPPGWDRRYTECFGYTLEEIYTDGTRSMESKLRAAGMPLDELPGPPIMPLDMSAEERSNRVIALLRAGFLGEKTGPPASDPESQRLLFDTMGRTAASDRVDGPTVLQWDFRDASPWHLRLANGSTTAEPGRVEDADLTLRCSYEDWVDVFSGRLDPRRALATGRLRPRGSVRTLLKLPRVFGG
ncbi:MAG TPA: ribonucleotide-diphosphate reductase subunit beta [Thermoleophilaceae bacterium]|nr:ribonucleotide-diphosphate reductase subunit beta [Thermoleophilaceae bacterium]